MSKAPIDGFAPTWLSRLRRLQAHRAKVAALRSIGYVPIEELPEHRAPVVPLRIATATREDESVA